MKRWRHHASIHETMNSSIIGAVQSHVIANEYWFLIVSTAKQYNKTFKRLFRATHFCRTVLADILAKRLARFLARCLARCLEIFLARSAMRIWPGGHILSRHRILRPWCPSTDAPYHKVVALYADEIVFKKI